MTGKPHWAGIIFALAGCAMAGTAGAQVTRADLEALRPQPGETLLPRPDGAAGDAAFVDEWLEGFDQGGQLGIARGLRGPDRAEEQKFFTLGATHAALVVQVRRQSTLDAVAALEGFREALVELGAPAGFFGFLAELELMVKSYALPPDAAARMAGALHGFLSDFVSGEGPGRLVNYQAGLWVTQLALTAQARENVRPLLGSALWFRDRYAEMDASGSVLEALTELAKLAETEVELTEPDLSAIQRYARQLQASLR